MKKAVPKSIAGEKCVSFRSVYPFLQIESMSRRIIRIFIEIDGGVQPIWIGCTLGLSGSQQGIRSKTAIELAVLSGAMLTARLQLPLAFPGAVAAGHRNIIATMMISIIIHV